MKSLFLIATAIFLLSACQTSRQDSNILGVIDGNGDPTEVTTPIPMPHGEKLPQLIAATRSLDELLHRWLTQAWEGDFEAIPLKTEATCRVSPARDSPATHSFLLRETSMIIFCSGFNDLSVHEQQAWIMTHLTELGAFSSGQSFLTPATQSRLATAWLEAVRGVEEPSPHTIRQVSDLIAQLREEQRSRD